MKLATLALFLLLLSPAFTAIDQGSREQFQHALTAALQHQDRPAFYALMCFDGLDPASIAEQKQFAEAWFRQARETPDFTANLSGSGRYFSPAIKYNLKPIASYRFQTKSGTWMNIPIGLKNGHLLISSPAAPANQEAAL